MIVTAVFVLLVSTSAILPPGLKTRPGLLKPLTPAVLFTASNTMVTFPASVKLLNTSISVALPLHIGSALLTALITGRGATATITVVVGTTSGQPSVVVTWKSYSTLIVVLVGLLNVLASVTVNVPVAEVTGNAA